jgi:uncharacterized protein (DUF2384 family)
MIKHGIRAAEAKRIIAELAIGQAAALKALSLSPATVNKKAKQNQPLSPSESERVIGLARLVGQMEAAIQESGDPEGFDAAAWMSNWLNEPVPALGGARGPSITSTPWRAKPSCPRRSRSCGAGHTLEPDGPADMCRHTSP